MIKNLKTVKKEIEAKRQTWDKLTDDQKRRLVEVLMKKIERLESARNGQPGKPRRTKRVSGGIALDKRTKGLADDVSLAQMYSGQLD